jgi:hypothetical protein
VLSQKNNLKLSKTYFQNNFYSWITHPTYEQLYLIKKYLETDTGIILSKPRNYIINKLIYKLKAFGLN